MENRIVYVKARFKPVGKYETVEVPTGEKTKGGLFSAEKEVMRKEKEWVQTGFSKSEVDGVALANDLQEAIEQLNGEGYEVISITGINSGDYDWKTGVSGNGGYGYGYGYSYTVGLVILARRSQGS